VKQLSGKVHFSDSQENTFDTLFGQQKSVKNKECQRQEQTAFEESENTFNDIFGIDRGFTLLATTAAAAATVDDQSHEPAQRSQH